MKPYARIAVTACLAAAAPAVFAGATSSLHINNVTITLTDLDASDGITPWIAMMHGSQPYLNIGAGGFDPSYSNDAYAALGTKAGSTLSGTASTPFAQSAATIAGTSSIVGYSSLALDGSAQSGIGSYGEYGGLAAAYTSMNFGISANTKVTITFNASIDVATTLGYDSASGLDELAKGHILMGLDGLDENGEYVMDEQWQELIAGYQFDALGNPLGQSLHWDGDLSVSFSNLTAADSMATLYTEGGIGGHSIAAVPEPTTYGMLLGGLALLGFVARRKKAA